MNHNGIPCEQSSDDEVALWSTTLKNVDSWTLPSRCRRICWVFVTTNNWLGLFSITLLRHLTHSKTTAQACSSVMGALNPLVIFSRDKQPSWVSWNGVQLVSLYFTFDEVAMILSNYGDCCFKLYFVKSNFWWFQIPIHTQKKPATRGLLPLKFWFKLSKKNPVTSCWRLDSRCHRTPFSCAGDFKTTASTHFRFVVLTREYELVHQFLGDFMISQQFRNKNWDSWLLSQCTLLSNFTFQ